MYTLIIYDCQNESNLIQAEYADWEELSHDAKVLMKPSLFGIDEYELRIYSN